jgi:hypothetical protein
MVARLVFCLLLPLLLVADERWIELRSGPFQVLTNGPDRNARDLLAQLDQIRYLVGASLTRPEPKTAWPFRVLLFKSAPPAAPAVPTLARDAYLAAVSGSALPPPMLREVVRLLMEANAGRMPAPIERGIEDFYSTAQVAATKITLGTPPPQRSVDWARIDLLVTSPEYAGTAKLRVLLYNLQQGSDPDPAFRNGFGKSEADIDKQAAAWLAGGSFPTLTISGKPLSPLRDYTPRAVEPAAITTALADLGLASGADAAPAYKALRNEAPAAAHEGLGLLALRAKRPDEAREELEAATAAGSTSARAWFEAAKLNPDPLKAAAALQKAAELNPNWAEPYVALADRESDPARKLNWLKQAAALEPRNAERWRAVAELYQTHHKYPEAAKAWSNAQSASVDEAERQRMLEARRAIDDKRLSYEAAEKQRQQEERQRELQKLKDAAMAQVRAAEDRANKANQRANPNSPVVPWWGGEAPSGKVEGTLGHIECAGRILRLVIKSSDGRQTRLAVRDARKVVVIGGGELSLKCGPQAPVRTVNAEFYAKPDPKLGTAGELAAIEYE